MNILLAIKQMEALAETLGIELPSDLLKGVEKEISADDLKKIYAELGV